MMSMAGFSSHEQQRQTLGCAAELDPDKYPRRYAAAQARTKKQRTTNSPTQQERYRAEREQLLPQLRALAPHYYITEVARRMGVCRKRLGRLAEEHGIQFAGRHGFTKQALSELVAQHQEKHADGNDIAAAVSESG